MIRIELNSNMPLQRPKCYVPLDPRLVDYLLPTAMICKIENHRLIYEFILPIESEL